MWLYFEDRLILKVEFVQGMKRFHVRKGVVEALKEAGLYVETKDNAMELPLCSSVNPNSSFLYTN